MSISSAEIPQEFRRLRLSCSAFEAFDRCLRRFELAHLRRLEWPGLSTFDLPRVREPARLGRAFHRLVGDWLAGGRFDPNDVDETDPALGRLWRQFSSRPPDLAGGRRIIEQEITLTLETAVVVARPDLICSADDGRLRIFDWKTSTPNPAGAVASSCQAKLYPYLLVEAADSLGLGTVEPDRVEMFFHFVTQPEQSVRVEHSVERHKSVETWLGRRVKEILESVDFPQTTDLAECSGCRFHTYCHVGGVDLVGQSVEEETEPSPVEYLDYF